MNRNLGQPVTVENPMLLPIGGQAISIGDTVGIKEELLYTGIGEVKEKDRGEVIGFAKSLDAAWVQFPQGKLMIFLRDLLIYESEQGVAALDNSSPLG